MKKQRLEDRRTLITEQQQEKERQYAQLEHKIQQAEQVTVEVTQMLQSFFRALSFTRQCAKSFIT